MSENFRLQDECRLLQDISEYTISNEHDIHSMDTHSISMLLEGEFKVFVKDLDNIWNQGAVESVADASDSITNAEVFDVYHSLLK